ARLVRNGWLRRHLRFPNVPGNKFHIASAFAGMSFLRGVNEKILERPEQKRTEPAATTIGALKPVVFQHVYKKILREILRIFYGIAACADKRENGSPISPAKLGERIARLLLFVSVVGGKDEAPAGSYKLARSLSTPVASLPVHERTLWVSFFYTSNKH